MIRKHINILVPILAAFVFGLYPAAAQLAYQDGANASFVIIVTTFFRATSMMAFCMATGIKWTPGKEDLKIVLMGGFFQALSIFGIIASLAYLPGPVTLIIVFTHTIMLLLLMGWLGEAQLTTAAIVTTLIALLGVGLVVDLVGNMENVEWLGILLAFIAAVATMSRMYIFGKEVKEANPVVVGARMFLTAFLFLLLLIAVDQPLLPQTSKGYLGIFLCTISLVAGTFCMFYGLALIGAFEFSLMLKLEPVFTALFSWIIMEEVLNSSQYFGMFLVIASLISYQYFYQKNV